MPRASWCRDEIYEFFDRWRRSCLIGDGAVLTGGTIWTDEHLRRLQTTLATDLGEGTYFEKLHAQLAVHDRPVRQLGVEIAYVEYLGERDTGAETKRRQLRALLDELLDGMTLPLDLADILDGGIASYGPGAGYRPAYVRFLLKLARAAKEIQSAQRAARLDDPWEFHALVESVRTSTDGLQANAVLHACFPDQFDVMISAGHRRRLLRRFAAVDLVVRAPDEPRKLLAVREALATRLPEPIDEPYDEAVRPIWDRQASAEWGELIPHVLDALGDDVADTDPAPLPDEDVDLLERLQDALDVNTAWDSIVREAAARVVAAGGTVRSWGRLVGALRDAVSLLPPDEDGTDVQVQHEPALAVATAELAGELLLRQSWLQKLIDLLADRRQLILYGPPGTGKTWLARRIAAHAFSPGDVRLVQFHPSYTYEDFVEGYRPRDRNGTLTYELVPGPLRDLCRQAAESPERPHLLIVDEINRGNLAKVFGELYFLLEYRDEPMRLQYSSEQEFVMPRNLHIIGTMNTADRSIALLDAALRRRFAFLELSPRTEPVRGLLGRWLARHGLEPDPHTLLETLNDMLAEADGDEDLAIGPSYFMSRSGAEPDLETIWEFDLLPLLVERFYGSGTPVHERFSLEAVRAEATRRADTGEPLS